MESINIYHQLLSIEFLLLIFKIDNKSTLGTRGFIISSDLKTKTGSTSEKSLVM